MYQGDYLRYEEVLPLLGGAGTGRDVQSVTAFGPSGLQTRMRNVGADGGNQGLQTRNRRLVADARKRPHFCALGYLLACRPFDPSLEGRIADLAEAKDKVSANREVVASHTCQVFKFPVFDGSIQRKIYVDPERDYSVIRIELLSRRGNVTRQETFSGYEPDARSGVWLPKRWEVMDINDDGSLLQRLDFSVEASDVNVAIPDDKFQLEFAKGDMVRDTSVGNDPAGLKGWSINMGNGKRREVLEHELVGGATREQLMATAPGRSLAAPLRRGRPPAVAAAVAVATVVAVVTVVAGALIGYRRSRRR